MDTKTALLGFFTPWIVYAIITLLHYALPGKWLQGYVKSNETGEPLRYRLNGIWVMRRMLINNLDKMDRRRKELLFETGENYLSSLK